MVNLALPSIPRSQMFAGVEGTMTLEWQEFFRNLYTRVGGYDAPDTGDLAQSLISLLFSTAPTNHDNRISELERRIESLPSPRFYGKEIKDLRLRIESLAYPRLYGKEIESLRLQIEALNIPKVYDNAIRDAQMLAMSDALEPSDSLQTLGHGCCHGLNIGWSQAAAVQNTWYPVSDATMDADNLHDVSHDGNGQLTVLRGGAWGCIWSLSGENSSNNDNTEVAIRVSGTETDHGTSAIETDKAGDKFNLASPAILLLAPQETVEVSIRTTDNNTPLLEVHFLNLVLFQIHRG